MTEGALYVIVSNGGGMSKRHAPDVRKCTKCKRWLPLEEFDLRGQRKREYAQQCDRCRDYTRQQYASVRARVISTYGGKCAECGETRLHMLQLDHVNNDGAEERRGRNANAHYFNADKEYRPDRYQVLCGPCNYAKNSYSREEYEAWKLRFVRAKLQHTYKNTLLTAHLLNKWG